MTDWTTVAVTLGAAGIAGLTGFGGALLAYRSTIKRIEADNQQLREHHQEDHLRNRQGTYHELLSADRRLNRAITHGASDVGKIYDRFQHLAFGVHLFGSDEANKAMQELVEVYSDISVEAKKAGAGLEPWKAARTQHQDRLNAAQGRLLEAMRADVGPR